MKKSKAIIILLCALLVLLGVGYVDLYGVDAEGTASASDISLGLDLAGGVSITYQVVGDEEPDATDMADTIAKLQKRVENYSKEAIVYQEGTDRINIEIPGVTDANKILEELGRPGSLYFIAETDKDGNANYSMQAVTDAQGNASYAYALNKTIDELKADGSIMLEGTDVKTATAGSIKDQTMGNSTYAVDLVMTEEGTKKFEEATRNAYEKGETLRLGRRMVCVEELPEQETGSTVEAEANLEWKEALRGLDEKYRLIVVLFYADGLRTAEIGKLLQLPDSTVRTRLARGREQLAKYYAETEEGGGRK